MIQGFKEFILRGNVIDLAVAVVIGAAFTGVVNAIVNNIFNPLIASIFKASDLENVAVWTLNGSDIRFGSVLGALIQFLLVAIVVYFVFVLPINHLKKAAFALKKTPAESLQEQNEELPPTETELLIQIRDLLAQERATAAGEPPSTGHIPKH
ncbi:large conductance mechanosensitive channel protein MscL [Herbiconiux liukaitaii]|uniref:large conductance mechanosensitive channel protein MscL n=1 Tax=Herbiconiux liukaitaii TaxID=3342799 RepID=UPI0035BACA6C